MKKLLIVPFLFLSSVLYAQSPIGAWEGEFEGSSGEKQRGVVIFADGYQVIAVYNAETGAFVSTNGGKWRLEGNTMTETVEFDTKTPERVGSDVTFELTDVKQLNEKFNAHLQGKLLILVDDVDKLTKSQQDVLKTVTTQKHIKLEKKGIDSTKEKCFFDTITTSNNGRFLD